MSMLKSDGGSHARAQLPPVVSVSSLPPTQRRGGAVCVNTASFCHRYLTVLDSLVFMFGVSVIKKLTPSPWIRSSFARELRHRSSIIEKFIVGDDDHS